MKSVGEVMAVGRTFEESLQKAIRQVDPRWKGFEAYVSPEDLDDALSKPTDMRLFAIAYAMYNKKYSVDQVHDLTKIDKVCGGFSSCVVCTERRLFSGSYIKSITSCKRATHSRLLVHWTGLSMN
jgi:hypothetical protein